MNILPLLRYLLVGLISFFSVSSLIAQDYPSALVLGRGEPFKDPGAGPTHPELAKLNFLRLIDNPENDPSKGWTCQLSWDVAKQLKMDPEKTTYEELFDAIGNWKLDFKIVIYNTAQGQLATFWDKAIENGIMPISAHYDNSTGKYIPDSIGLRTCIGVGGGVKSNIYTYGPALEFYDALPGRFTHSSYEDPVQSWASQVVAAKFAKIMNAHPAYNIWDARQHMRQAASHWELGWTEKNGYGRVDPDKEIGELMPAPPVDFQTRVIENGNKVVFSWRNFAMSDFANTVVGLKGGGVLYRGKGNTFTWDSTIAGDAEVLFWSENTKGARSRMESYQTRVIPGLRLFGNRSCMIVGAGPMYDSINEVLRQQFLKIADNWVCDVAYIKGNPARDKNSQYKQGHNLGVFDSYEAMVDYAIRENYSILIVASDLFRAREIHKERELWKKAVKAGIGVVLPHGYTLAPAMRIESQKHVPDRLSAAITSGRGRQGNELSRGRGLEFIDDADPIQLMIADRSENTAAAVIAGKLAKIMDANPEYNYWDARQHLRQMSERKWNSEVGFGRIELAKMRVDRLALAPPVDIRAVKLNEGRQVKFQWQNFLQNRFESTVIRLEDGTEIYRGKAEEFEWPSEVTGNVTFHFHTVGREGEMSAVQPFSVIEVEGLRRE